MLPKISNALVQLLNPVKTVSAIETAASHFNETTKEKGTRHESVGAKKRSLEEQNHKNHSENGENSGTQLKKKTKDQSQSRNQNESIDPLNTDGTFVIHLNDSQPIPEKRKDPEESPVSVSTTFISMINALHKTRGEFSKWVGNSRYEAENGGPKSNKKKSFFRKGAMIDEDAA